MHTEKNFRLAFPTVEKETVNKILMDRDFDFYYQITYVHTAELCKLDNAKGIPTEDLMNFQLALIKMFFDVFKQKGISKEALCAAIWAKKNNLPLPDGTNRKSTPLDIIPGWKPIFGTISVN